MSVYAIIKPGVTTLPRPIQTQVPGFFSGSEKIGSDRIRSHWIGSVRNTSDRCRTHAHTHPSTFARFTIIPNHPDECVYCSKGRADVSFCEVKHKCTEHSVSRSIQYFVLLSGLWGMHTHTHTLTVSPRYSRTHMHTNSHIYMYTQRHTHTHP